MAWLKSWWWPKRPVLAVRTRIAGLLAGLGAALFGVSALVLKTGAVSWDRSLFRILNEVPAAAASVLTPLSHLFLPAGIIIFAALAIALCRGKEPEHPAGGGRSRGGGRRVAAGACG